MLAHGEPFLLTVARAWGHAFAVGACVVLALGCHAAPDAKPLPPPPSAVATGQYQNLFIEAGYAQGSIDTKIHAAYEQLFNGEPSDEAVYFTAGSNEHGPLGYIHDIGDDDVRSEGMSYGMMIAVQMDEKGVFDALWNWAQTFMYHAAPEHPAYGYFSWSLKTTGEPNDEMPAPDGEEYFATALYFADARWGSASGGFYDYRAHANRLLTDMVHRESITGTTSRGEMTAVSLFDTTAKMVRFTPDVVNKDHTDPSYHLPAFYEVWARLGPEADRTFWSQAAQASRDYFVKSADPHTGLTPDYGNFDASPWAASWRPESANFVADAWRSAMNWSVDLSWWAKDGRQTDLSNRLQSFFQAQGLDGYGNSYTLAGEKRGDGPSAGLVAMNAVAGLASDNARRKTFVQALWNRAIPTGQYRYYDGMLYLMALLHCGGQFKAWGL